VPLSELHAKTELNAKPMALTRRRLNMDIAFLVAAASCTRSDSTRPFGSRREFPAVICWKRFHHTRLLTGIKARDAVLCAEWFSETAENSRQPLQAGRHSRDDAKRERRSGTRAVGLALAATARYRHW
jgi:hypothetical protein